MRPGLVLRGANIWWATISPLVHRVKQNATPQAAQLFLTQPAFSDKFPEDEREVRVPVVVLAVDLFAAFRQIMFQIPQIRWLLDFVAICFAC